MFKEWLDLSKNTALFIFLVLAPSAILIGPPYLLSLFIGNWGLLIIPFAAIFGIPLYWIAMKRIFNKWKEE